MSTDFFVVRTTDPDTKELICGSIQISNDCVFELMKIKSLSELLPSRIQPRQVLLEPELSNAKVIVIINGRHTYTTPTHWDEESNYLFVVKGEKTVYLGRDKKDVPKQLLNSKLQCAFQTFSPHDWYLKGSLEQAD